MRLCSDLIFNYQITNLLNYQILDENGAAYILKKQNSRNRPRNDLMLYPQGVIPYLYSDA